jgi:hypothetical protein
MTSVFVRQADGSYLMKELSEPITLKKSSLLHLLQNQ